MKEPVVTLSSKYQVVIPKAARKKLGLTTAAKQHFRVTRVTENEIVFQKDKSLEDFLGAYTRSFPKDAARKLRQARDTEWNT